MSKIDEAFSEWAAKQDDWLTSMEAFKAGADYAKERDAKICDEYGGHLFGHECAEYIRSQE